MPAERIERIRKRYQREVPRISVERARFYTESWRSPATRDEPLPVRVSLAMKNVFENMTIHLDPDDRLAGTWCECFLGTPVDIERGLYNEVLATELRTWSLVLFRLRRLVRFLVYAVRNRRLGELTGGRRAGPLPLDLSLKTMRRRKVNPFAIEPADERLLLGTLLPYWQDRTAAEGVEQTLRRACLFSPEVRDFLTALAVTPSRQVIVTSPATALCTYQGHLIPDLEPVLREGLLAMRERVRAERTAGPDLAPEQQEFLRSLEIALEGVILFAARLRDAVERALAATGDDERRLVLARMLQDCRQSPLQPARSFRQAVQAVWTVKCALDLANPTNVLALGRLDQLLYPFYRQDLEAGRIDREQARELLEELLLKVMAHNIRPESNVMGNFYLRFEGSEPVTLGGLTPQGADATNELTYVLIEAAESSRAVTNVVLRVHPETPDELYLALAEACYRGASNLSVMNDEIHVEALRRRGFALEDARDYAVTGCTDVIAPGKTGSLSVSGLLLARLLDLTLRNGDLMTLAGPVRNAGPRTGEPEGFTSFEQFLAAFVEQGAYAIRRIVEASNLRDRVFAEKLPAPFVSAFMGGCLESKRDVTRGGATYDLSVINMINSVANVVDSLYVIKRLVFEEGRFTLRELRDATERDFEGAEPILARIRALAGKWGNADPEADRLAREVTDRLFRETGKYRGYKDSPWAPVINSMTSHTIDGRLSIATPDGRRAATPYASSCNPYQVEKNGITCVLRSVAGLDFRQVLGCSVNVRLHPTAIGGNPEKRRKWVQLLRTYFALGGPQLQPTVASAETLRAAQQDPDAHSGLLVKVGGYSAYFTELGREIQQEVIARTEHGAA